MISYTHPAGVQAVMVDGVPLLTLPQGGRIAVDAALLELWRAAHAASLPQVLQAAAGLGLSPSQAALALACLSQAGVLERHDAPPQPPAAPAPLDSALVSVIVVSFNSQRWLEGCFSSLARQTHSNLEIILVDNASQDDSLIWTQAHYSQVNCLRLEQVASFAAALNYGLAQARGQFLLLLNPDVTLEPDAIAHLLAAARAHPGCGAVAPKLRLLWAPAFLNGLGNQVGALLWGSDVAQGALDVGQLDDLPELPSACFAAALIPRPVLEAVGLVDEGFPMYYEDSEWSYRARLLGYAIVPAPQAVIYHAFSSRVPEGQPLSLPSLKLRRLAYGRLRWATKLLSGAWRVRFTLPYRLEDLLRMAAALARGHKDTAAAHGAAWADLRRDASEIAAARQALDGRRKCTYPALFAPQRHLPPPRVWRGLPLLTIDIILADLSPWLAQRASLNLPEWQVLPALLPPPDRPPGAWRRMRDVLRREGRLALLLRMAKAVARRLARP